MYRSFPFSLTATAAALAATCMFAALPAQAVSVYQDDNVSFDLFGRAQALLLSGHGSQPDRDYSLKSGDDTLASAFRLGMSARSKLTDGLDGIMMAEWDMPDGSLDTTDTRYLFVGIDAYQYGVLMAGKGDTAYYAVAGATDIYNYLDSRANDYYVMGDTLPGQIMYRLAALSYDLRISYQSAGDRINGTPFSVRNGAAISLATRMFDKVSIAYGISYTDLTYAGDGNAAAMENYFAPVFAKDYGLTEEEARQYARDHHPGHKYDYGIAVSYGVLGDGPYAAFVFTGTDYECLTHQLYTYELAADYSFDNGWGINGGVALQQYGDFFTVADLNLGLYYKFNESFKVFAESQMDLGAQPERCYGWGMNKHAGEDKFVLGAELAF